MMSFKEVGAEGPKQEQTVGPWLRLWQIQQIIWSLSLIISQLSMYPSYWAAFTDRPAIKDPNYTQAEHAAQIILVTYAGLHLLAAICLFRRHWSAVRTALILQWVASLGATFSLFVPIWYPAIRYLLYVPLDVWIALPFACTAYFLASSRISTCYPQSVPRTDEGHQEPWRLLLVAFLMSPLILALYQFQQDSAKAISHIGQLQPGQWLDVATSVLFRDLKLMLRVLALLIAGCLLQWRRQRSTIPVVIVLLWSWPLYVLGTEIRHYATFAPTLISMSLDGETWGTYMLIRSTANHLNSLLGLGWAIAWTGYLLESAFIRRLYPDKDGQSRAVVNVDAF